MITARYENNKICTLLLYLLCPVGTFRSGYLMGEYTVIDGTAPFQCYSYIHSIHIPRSQQGETKAKRDQGAPIIWDHLTSGRHSSFHRPIDHIGGSEPPFLTVYARIDTATARDCSSRWREVGQCKSSRDCHTRFLTNRLCLQYFNSNTLNTFDYFDER
jgi:hypothetical protein